MTGSGHIAQRSLGSRRGTFCVAAAVLCDPYVLHHVRAAGERLRDPRRAGARDPAAQQGRPHLPFDARARDGDRLLHAAAHGRADRPSGARSGHEQTRTGLDRRAASRASEFRHRLDLDRRHDALVDPVAPLGESERTAPHCLLPGPSGPALSGDRWQAVHADAAGQLLHRRGALDGRSAAGGPYALATSDRSDVFQEFDGGPGQIAIHGMDNLPGALGTASSHGCIRLDDVRHHLALDTHRSRRATDNPAVTRTAAAPRSLSDAGRGDAVAGARPTAETDAVIGAGRGDWLDRSGFDDGGSATAPPLPRSRAESGARKPQACDRCGGRGIGRFPRRSPGRARSGRWTCSRGAATTRRPREGSAAARCPDLAVGGEEL